MRKFLHIYIVPKKGISQDAIEVQMDKALDWYRYSAGVYIVYTNAEPAKWKIRLEGLVKKSGSLFICELNIDNHKGWMSKDFWAWLRKTRGE